MNLSSSSHKGVLSMEVRCAHYPLTWGPNTTPTCDSWFVVLSYPLSWCFPVLQDLCMCSQAAEKSPGSHHPTCETHVAPKVVHMFQNLFWSQCWAGQVTPTNTGDQFVTRPGTRGSGVDGFLTSRRVIEEPRSSGTEKLGRVTSA